MVKHISFSLVLAANHCTLAAPSSYSKRDLRISSDLSSAQGLNLRSWTDNELTVDDPNPADGPLQHRSLKGEITRQCFKTLVASATNGRLWKQNYFVFTDGMSNGYYTFSNMTEYGDLPMKNKFGFSTLSCQCHSFGGSGNCCQGERAHIDVTGINSQGGVRGMDRRLRGYVSDICRVTNNAIGDDKLPPTGELQATQWPTSSVAPTESSRPSSSPSSSGMPSEPPSTSSRPSGSPSYSLRPSASPRPSTIYIPAAIAPSYVGKDKGGGVGGLSPGAWAGIAIAAAVVTALMVFIFAKRKTKENIDYEDHTSDRQFPDGQIDAN